MSNKRTGVFPCYENQFQINAAASGESDMQNIAECESFSVSFDNGIEEWHAFEHEGWVSRLMTAKALTITVSGKRSIGDAGNDAVAALTFENGRNVERDFQWTFPDGTKMVLKSAVINVTNIGAGDATAVGPLEFQVMSNGKPEIIPAA